jgi:hypothetical protein
MSLSENRIEFSFAWLKLWRHKINLTFYEFSEEKKPKAKIQFPSFRYV